MQTISALASENRSETFYPLTVGSLPPFADFIKGRDAKATTKATVEDAIKIQADHGIHFPSTGEAHATNNDSMVKAFFQAFEGIGKEDGTVTGTLKVKPDEKLRELPVIKEIESAKTVIDQLISENVYGEFVALKATIPGPGLLAQEVLDETDKKVSTLMSIFAEGLVEIAQLMYVAGARVIQIDEPLFTKGPKYHVETIRALQSLFSQLRLRLTDLKFLSLHMCGDHSDETLSQIGNLDFDLLDCEFSGHQNNYNIITNEWLTSNGKNIGIGVVSGDVEFVEEDNDIIRDVNRIFENYDPDIVLLKPDCQLRLLKLIPQVAVAKLERIKFSREKLLELLSTSSR